MRHIRTKLGVENKIGESHELIGKLLDRFDANPEYDHSLVDEWYIEFDDEGWPGREIGLDSHELPVLAGPDDRNYGFWLDTNMQYNDFNGAEISAEHFEEKWNCWIATRKKRAGD